MMRHYAMLIALLVFAGLTSACGSYANTVEGDVSVPSSNGPNPQNLPDPNAVPKPTTPNGYAVSPSPVTIEEVLVDPMGPNAGNQYIELFNASAFDADIGGWVLSDGNSSHTFAYGFTVAAGERVVVHVGATGTDTSADQFSPSFNTLGTQGSLALMRSGVDLVDYVQWGGSPNNFENTADQMAEWTQGDFITLPSEGQSINYDGTANDSSAWHAGNVTPGS
jgi:hypothetical protein